MATTTLIINGFTYGESLISFFLLLIVIMIFFGGLKNAIFGIKISNKEIQVTSNKNI